MSGLARRLADDDEVQHPDERNDDRGNEEDPGDIEPVADHAADAEREDVARLDHAAEDPAERAALADVEPGRVDLDDRERAEALEVAVERDRRGEVVDRVRILVVERAEEAERDV